MKTATKAEIKKLETIVIKLEKWQARNMQHDPEGKSSIAKNKLMDLLRILEGR